MTWRKQIPTKTSICTTNAFKSAPCRHNVISIVPGHIYSASIKKRTQLNPSTVKDHINRRTSKTYIKVFKVNIYSKWLPDNPEITLAACCLRSAADPANDGRRKKKKHASAHDSSGAGRRWDYQALSAVSPSVVVGEGNHNGQHRLQTELPESGDSADNQNAGIICSMWAQG